MAVALLIARFLLAGVFAVAGVAKLVDRDGSRRSFSEFGVPDPLAIPLSILLPLAELSVAAALLPTATAWWGALGAVALLGLFVAAVSVALVRGRKPECHCFGQLHSAPAGWSTLARNAALAAVASSLVWLGWEGNLGPSAIAWLGTLSTTQLLVLVGVIVMLGLLGSQWWFLLHLFHQNGRLLVRIEALESRTKNDAAPSHNGAPARAEEGLPLGAAAPDFSLSGLYGETHTLESLRAPGNPVMLLFTDPGCGPCTAMLPEIGRWQEEHAEKLTISLISRGDPEENRAKSTEHSQHRVLLQRDWEVSEAYRVNSTPSGVLVRADGTIASPVVGGAEGIRNLLAHALGERTQLPTQLAAQGHPCPKCGKVHAASPTVPAALQIGEPAPEVRLTDLEGNTVELEDFRGEETLVLFWNPGCGFCQQMLPDIKSWEENPPQGAPRLLVVSAGTREANEAMGLVSPVVLDQSFATGRAFGAGGTPSAVLVNAVGEVSSGVAVGAPAVLELVRGDRTAA